ncbi:MAG: PhzF family phenazine biosynthesis protein [Thermoanaerobaculia bacterium]
MKIYQVDAFTDQPFSGNPAAVCPLPSARSAEWMQAVAAEMNLSETAFFWPSHNGFELRWFTPAVEVALCGHATLATAHVAWETRRASVGQSLRFLTRSGPLTATRSGRNITLDLPSQPAEETEAPQALTDALAADIRWVGRTRENFLVLLPREEQVVSLEPDIRALASLEAQGVIVTAAAHTEGFDFVSRYFAPAVGIDEDPVTGSAHCTLAPFWRARLGKDEMVGLQASARGGRVLVRDKGRRVEVGGRAVTVLEGELLAG